MAYRLKHGESVPVGIQRIARDEIRSAIQQLRGKAVDHPDEAIHEVRKSIKKMRALLRLVRPGLGPVYNEENGRFRDTGRRLRDVRDAGAMVTAFDDLKTRCKKTLGRAPLAPARRALVLHKKRAEEEAGIEGLLADLASAFGQSLRSIKRWPLEADGFAAVGPGLKKTFRAGRRALAVAEKHGSREDFHEWRKRVKDHWYHVRLFENFRSDMMKGYENSLKEIEHALGDDLDLAMLREWILAAPDAHGGREVVDRVMHAIDGSRKELRSHALKLGRRVYAEKPGKFTAMMEKLWKTWRESPV